MSQAQLNPRRLIVKGILLLYARYTQRANQSVIALLDGLSIEERNKDRKSYYKSLSGLMSHSSGGNCHGLFRAAVPSLAKTLKATEGLEFLEAEKLSAEQWAELKRVVAIADKTTIDFIEAATEAELATIVKDSWFKDKPDGVPLCFLLHCFFVHGTHHRGQISQILDEMGIEHDFSGLDVEFLGKE
jgi:uncharacterized damage-inducible protein DinB